MHYVKSALVKSFSDPYFPAFGLNNPSLSVFGSNAEKYGSEKLRIRIIFAQWWLKGKCATEKKGFRFNTRDTEKAWWFSFFKSGSKDSRSLWSLSCTFVLTFSSSIIRIFFKPGLSLWRGLVNGYLVKGQVGGRDPRREEMRKVQVFVKGY